MGTIYNNMSVLERQYLIARCGWVTNKGFMSKLGLKISNTPWDRLSEAARNVIERKLRLSEQGA